MADPLHDDEVLIDPSVARRLVDDQFPDWAALPLRPVSEFGTDHVLFRLGDELVVRFPRSEFGKAQIASDGQWLPHLAEHLPVALPEQVAVGQPGDGYPLRWSVVRWLPGAAPDPASVGSTSVARDLGGFVTALRAVPLDGVPLRTDRGAPLALRDDVVREDLDALGTRVDRTVLEEIWTDALAAPVWSGPPMWVHGDLKAGNFLIAGDRLAGVIDWIAGAGDPALDLTPAWLTLRPEARDAFRESAGLDDAAWARGRGWALTISLRELPYYWERSPVLAEGARRGIAAVIAEFEGQ